MAKAKKEGGREKKITSFQIYTDTKKKVNYISTMEEIDITEIVESALVEYVAKYERKNGAIPVK